MILHVGESSGSMCDLCRVRGDEPQRAVELIPIAIRDVHATLCVCPRHQAEVDRVADNVMLARRMRNSSPDFPRLRADEDRAVIRRWAQATRLPVSTSGTISAAVLRAYREAHGTQRQDGQSAQPASSATNDSSSSRGGRTSRPVET